jgi:hypothetical protein
MNAGQPSCRRALAQHLISDIRQGVTDFYERGALQRSSPRHSRRSDPKDDVLRIVFRETQKLGIVVRSRRPTTAATMSVGGWGIGHRSRARECGEYREPRRNRSKFGPV